MKVIELIQKELDTIETQMSAIKLQLNSPSMLALLERIDNLPDCKIDHAEVYSYNKEVQLTIYKKVNSPKELQPILECLENLPYAKTGNTVYGDIRTVGYWYEYKLDDVALTVHVVGRISTDSETCEFVVEKERTYKTKTHRLVCK